MPNLGNLLTKKKTVVETLHKQIKLTLTGLPPVKNGYFAYTEFEKDVEKLLSVKAKTILDKVGLTANLPPKVRAQRSIICRQIDHYIGQNTANDIKDEINDKNSQLTVTEIISFKSYTHVFKIEFQTTKMADLATRNGLDAFNLRITPSQIQKEKFVDLLMCFNCYKLEDHTTKDCPTVDETKKCSECAGDHNYRDCNTMTKKCLNCGGAHRTMAMSCPTRKALINNKIQTLDIKDDENRNQTFANMVKKDRRN